MLIAPKEAQEEVARQVARGFERQPGDRSRHEELVWDAILRKVHKHSPGFDA